MGWECDSVHGNVITTGNKYKTRKVEDILEEIKQAIAVHKESGSVLGGIHVEVTGQKTVTECLGGCIGLTEDMLPTNYETYCDPRLNYAQSLEMSPRLPTNSALRRKKCALHDLRRHLEVFPLDFGGTACTWRV